MVRSFLLLAFCVITSVCIAQKIATLEVELSQPTNGLSVPVKINLDEITLLPDSVLSLAEVQGAKKTPVPYQVENGDHRSLYWIIETDNNVKKHVYELTKGSGSKNANTIKTKVEDGTLTIQGDGKNLIRYNFKTVYPPAGVDTAFKRSGFIHPLWSPHGQVLTRIQAPDHYHHYGIWNPWTHVLFEGDTLDFWNLKDRKGTVRFANFVSTAEGPVYGEYQVLQQHVAFK